MITGIVAGYPLIVAPPPAGATHWRAVWVENFGDAFSTCAELSLRTASGGSSAAVGGVAIASSEYNAEQSASKAFDGSSTTSWSTAVGGANGAWIGYVFPANVTIVELAITMSSTGTGGFRSNQMPRKLLLQYSNDGGGTWLTAALWDNNASWVLGQTKVFTTPTAPVRYWRVIWDAVYGSEAYASCGELSFRATSGGGNLADGSYAIKSSEYSSADSASKAFDSNLDTAWSSDGASVAGQWLGHGFTSLVDVVEVGITMKATSSGGFRVAQMPKNFRVQFSDDLGFSWTTKATFTDNPPWVFGETKAFAIP